MAFVAEFICIECRRFVNEVVDGSSTCARCRLALAKADKDAHMSRLSILPIEERVRRIEEMLYDLNTDSRLRKLECRNVSY